MRELEGAQQGDRWMEHRIGRLTASRMNDLTAYSKTGLKKTPPVYEELAKRHDYRYELLAERLTRREQRNIYVTPAVEWGIEQEERAKQVYEMATGQMVLPVGFVLHPRLDMSGASADGLLDDAVMEIKCPDTTTFLEWQDLDGVPEEHQLQIQWEMACCEKDLGIFMAYDPRLPEGNRCFFRELKRDQAKIDWLESEVLKMDAEIEALIQKRGLPPTVWDVTGNPVIHHVPEGMALDPANISGPEWAFLDSDLADVP